MLEEVYVCVRVDLINIPLQFNESNLVALLVLAVIVKFFLDRIVRQVNHIALQVGQSKLLARGSDVAILVPVRLKIAIDAGEKHIHPDVELPFLVEERVVDVLLDNIRF